MQRPGAQQLPASGGGAGGFRQCLMLSKNITCLAKIALVLQVAPGKMLTVSQLMDKLPLMCEDRKSHANNIRVCLSINECFVKIPMAHYSPNSKKNYWKLDPSQITAKMVRRHFKGLLWLFPELASKVETENRGRPSELRSGARPRGMFAGPFAIDSLVTRDGEAGEASGEDVPVREERRDPGPSHSWVDTVRRFNWNREQRYLRASAVPSPFWSAGGSTHHENIPLRLFSDPPFYTEPPFPVYPEPAFPFYTEPPFPLKPFIVPFYPRPSVASFTTPRGSGYSLPAFSNDARYFPL